MIFCKDLRPQLRYINSGFLLKLMLNLNRRVDNGL
jgi:hypothetical protein